MTYDVSVIYLGNFPNLIRGMLTVCCRWVIDAPCAPEMWLAVIPQTWQLETPVSQHTNVFSVLFPLSLNQMNLLQPALREKNCCGCGFGTPPHNTHTHTDKRRYLKSFAPWAAEANYNTTPRPSLQNCCKPQNCLRLKHVHCYSDLFDCVCKYQCQHNIAF